jgi:arylsulfatase
MARVPVITQRMAASHAAPVPYSLPPDGAPNVVVIVLDDVGFAQLGCFGSSIETPNIDRLAAQGLRYNRFHVTSICSSTRAALLTGRNHHAVGVGMTQETNMVFPGYTGRIPKSAALLPRVLRDNGYNTFAVGKWHLAPGTDYSAAGPTDRWPLGMGFDRFYGFLGAETNQWAPELVRDNTAVDPPRTPEEGYHLTEDLVDQAIRMVRDQHHAAPDKPFLCYLAFGAAHAPHQVPREWIERYRGRFDDGWEAERERAFERQLAEGVVPKGTTMTPRPSWVPEWESLSDDERRVYARYMEVFAAFVSHTDAHIGRFLDFLAAEGVLDDTLLVLLSDNGASSEGGVTGTLNETAAWMGTPQDLQEALDNIDEIGGHRLFNHYPWGWAWAGNAPFRLWKRYSWLGGVRTPLIVRWPQRIPAGDEGAVRSQFCHVNDLFPTVLDAIGIPPPTVVDGVTQQRIDGSSLAATFTDADAPEFHTLQYFEMHGSRALYHDGWKATTDFVSPLFGERDHIPGSTDHADDRWSLFDLDHDFAEAIDVADDHPDLVRRMEELWWTEAGRNQVLPLFEAQPGPEMQHPGEYPRPPRAVYRPGGGPIGESRLPALIGGFALTADVDVAAGAAGTICALGDRHGGWALYLLDGLPVATFVVFGRETRVQGSTAVPAGRHSVGLRYGGPRTGELELVVDGDSVGSGRLPIPPFFAGVSTAAGGMLVGRDRGIAVSDDYEPPFPFTGTLHAVVLESTAPKARPDAAAQFTAATRAD